MTRLEPWNTNGRLAAVGFTTVNPTSSFVTSTNAIELVPYAYPPSDLKVTPVLDGETYPQLTSVISISSFNPSYSITGSSSLCSTAIYSVNNLPNGVAVTSWDVSKNNIATISENGNQATLTATGKGAITVSATLVNSCGQTATIEKNNIWVGRPDVVYGILGNSGDRPVKSTSSFHITSVNNNSYHWSISTLNNDCGLIPGNPPYNTTPKFVVNGGNFSSTATGSAVTVFWGNCAGRYKISCRAVNACGSTGVGDKTVEVVDGSSGGGGAGCPEGKLITYPNPVTQGGDMTVNIIDPEPCIGSLEGGQSPANATNNANTGTIQTWVKIYDLNGIEKYTGTFTGNDFTITGLNLPHGLYVIQVDTSAGFTKQEILAVD